MLDINNPSASQGNWRLPVWVKDGFEKDEMARKCEEAQREPFLRTGVAPRVDMHMYLQLNYEHDGSHPETFRGWARMYGRITHVFEPPEVGVYAVYRGQQPRLSQQQLQELRKHLPALPPALFDRAPAELVLATYGAVHGQRIRAKIELTCDDDPELAPQLGGCWDAELICNDNMGCMWVVCAMQPGAEDQD